MRFVSATDPASRDALIELEHKMELFYNSTQAIDYFRQASALNEVWKDTSPQGVLLRMASRGMRVLDMGCGSACAWLHLQSYGVDYTGVDWSSEQIKKNLQNYKNANFVCASLYQSGLPSGFFDMVFSCYVLEHIVRPDRLLREMVRLVNHNGTLVIITPHYRKAGRAPSLPFGGYGSIRDKIVSRRFIQASAHAFLRLWWPLILATHHEPFLINLKPTCLTEPYRPDNDAIYFPARAECVEMLNSLGMSDVTDEFAIKIPRDVCLIIARHTESVSP